MQAIDFYYSGREEYDKGDFEKAIQYLEHSNQIDEHYKTYYFLYLSWKKMDEPEKALLCLEHAFLLNPRSDLVSVAYAGELALRNQIARAREILDDTIQRNPTYRPAIRFLEALP